MSMPKSALVECIGQKIRKLREQAGYTQDGFAYHVDISRGHYSCIETGRFGASIEKLTDIAIALNVPINDLFPAFAELKKLRAKDKK